MHIIIINASPYGNSNSNTKMIVDAFAKAVAEYGIEADAYSLCDRTQWQPAFESIAENRHIVFALPVYVGITPSMFKEFAEQLDKQLTADCRKKLNISYILQSAFPERSQRACCEGYLKSLTEHLGCNFCGVLSHSVFYGLVETGRFNNLIDAYNYFGKKYIENNCTFFFREAVDFNGPEVLSEKQAKKFVRGFNFMCRMIAEEKGCKKDLYLG